MQDPVYGVKKVYFELIFNLFWNLKVLAQVFFVCVYVSEKKICDCNGHHCFDSQKSGFRAWLAKFSYYELTAASMKKILVIILNKLVTLGRELDSHSSTAAATKKT